MQSERVARLRSLMQRHASGARLPAYENAEMHRMLKRRAAFGMEAHRLHCMADTMEMQAEALARVPVLRSVSSALAALNGAVVDTGTDVHRALVAAVQRAGEAQTMLSRSFEPADINSVDVHWTEALNELLPGVPAEEPVWMDTSPLVDAAQSQARAARGKELAKAEMVMVF